MSTVDYSSNTINTDVTNFAVMLSSNDTDVQKALDKIDDFPTTAPVFSNGIKVGKVWHAYGGYADQNLTLTCGADTWTHVTNTAGTLWTGSEADGISMVSDEMVIANSGDYAGQVSLTLSALAGKDFTFRIYNVTQSASATSILGISTTGAGNKMCLSMPVYLEATADDHFQLQINSADGTDPVLDHAVFYVAYLHD